MHHGITAVTVDLPVFSEVLVTQIFARLNECSAPNHEVFAMTKVLKLFVLAIVLAPCCLGTAMAGDREKLVGRWDQSQFDGCYIRFADDGTYKWVALLSAEEGKYRVRSDGVLELETPGVFYGHNVVELKYMLTGDTLELRYWFSSWAKFHRVK